MPERYVCRRPTYFFGRSKTEFPAIDFWDSGPGLSGEDPSPDLAEGTSMRRSINELLKLKLTNYTAD